MHRDRVWVVYGDRLLVYGDGRFARRNGLFVHEDKLFVCSRNDAHMASHTIVIVHVSQLYATSVNDNCLSPSNKAVMMV